MGFIVMRTAQTAAQENQAFTAENVSAKSL